MVDSRVIISIVVIVCAVGAGVGIYYGVKDDNKNAGTASEVQGTDLEMATQFHDMMGDTCKGVSPNDWGIQKNYPNMVNETTGGPMEGQSCLAEYCTEIEGRTVDQLDVSCADDASMCITGVQLWSTVGKACMANSENCERDNFPGTVSQAAVGLCASSATECSSRRRLGEGGVGRKLIHSPRKLGVCDWFLNPIKNALNGLNFGCCTTSMKISGSDTAMCAPDDPNTNKPYTECGVCDAKANCGVTGVPSDKNKGFVSTLGNEKDVHTNVKCNPTSEILDQARIQDDLSATCCYFHDLCLATADDNSALKFWCDAQISTCANKVSTDGPSGFIKLMQPIEFWWGFSCRSWYPSSCKSNWYSTSIQHFGAGCKKPGCSDGGKRWDLAKDMTSAQKF